jgi:SNF2 family DNA or RNA helicase
MPHTFRPHQVQAFEYAMARTRIALFMEMRLGKTPVAIRWAVQRGFRRVLIVAPLGPLTDWMRELHIEGIPPSSITDLYPLSKPARLEAAYGGSGFYLINYEALRITPALCDMDWDCVIADESTKIRNPKAQITKTFLKEFAAVPARALLSGLPNPEGPSDYFSQMQWLTGHFMNFGNYWAWRNTFFHQDERIAWQWHPNRGTLAAVKESVHNAAFVMTRQRAGMGETKIRSTRYVDMNAKQVAAMKQLKKNFQYEYIETNFATVRDVWLARLAGGFSPDRENPELLSDAKYNELYNLLTGELKNEQVVVWFRFNEELIYVTTQLNKKGIRATSFTGASDRAERERARTGFQEGRYQVICGQVQVGKYSMNLSAADTAIYYSNSYEFEARTQSEDRIVHMTKQKPLLYIDLVTRGSIDVPVVQSLNKKKRDAAMFSRQLQQFMVQEFRRSSEGKDQEGKAKDDRPEIKAGAQGLRAKASRIFPGAQTVRRRA